MRSVVCRKWPMQSYPGAVDHGLRSHLAIRDSGHVRSDALQRRKTRSGPVHPVRTSSLSVCVSFTQAIIVNKKCSFHYKSVESDGEDSSSSSSNSSPLDRVQDVLEVLVLLADLVHPALRHSLQGRAAPRGEERICISICTQQQRLYLSPVQ